MLILVSPLRNAENTLQRYTGKGVGYVSNNTFNTKRGHEKMTDCTSPEYYIFSEKKYYNTRNCDCVSIPNEVPSLTAFSGQRNARNAVYKGSSLGFRT